ncbi:MAG: DUF4118 domain-containing protein [Chloroflexota bacterium]
MFQSVPFRPGSRPGKLFEYGVALGGVALVTVVIALVLPITHIGNTSLLYLLVVLAVATAFGSGPAIAASVAAFLTFDWFFIEPFHTLTVADPGEWLSLLLFLATGVVTGQLAAGQRRQARAAQQRASDALFLFDLTRQLAAPEVAPALTAVAERIRAEMDLAAVAIVVPQHGGRSLKAIAGPEWAQRRLNAAVPTASYVFTGDNYAGARPETPRRRWVRVARSRGTGAAPTSEDLTDIHRLPVGAGPQVGSLMLVDQPGRPNSDPRRLQLLVAAATQIGIAAERALLRDEATEAEVLRRTGELKTQLINAVSHDFRTPLASIIASAGSLQQEDVQWTAGERMGFAAAIEQEAMRLNRLVGNLLDLSRIEGGVLRPDKRWWDLGALLDDVVGRVKRIAGTRVIATDVPADHPPVFLDYVKICQVLINLLENAVALTPPGSTIAVRALLADNETQIEVADQGLGIPPAALPHLFEPFYRADQRSSRPGLGLGLAVAKGLVEAHGGHIWAANLPGGGAAFTFSLPSAPTPSAPTPAAPEQDDR